MKNRVQIIITIFASSLFLFTFSCEQTDRMEEIESETLNEVSSEDIKSDIPDKLSTEKTVSYANCTYALRPTSIFQASDDSWSQVVQSSVLDAPGPMYPFDGSTIYICKKDAPWPLTVTIAGEVLQYKDYTLRLDKLINGEFVAQDADGFLIPTPVACNEGNPDPCPPVPLQHRDSFQLTFEGTYRVWLSLTTDINNDLLLSTTFTIVKLDYPFTLE